MNSNVRIVQNNGVSSSTGSSPSLHDGSVVKARVIAQTGNNSFSVSIAGQRVNVTSSLPLVKGEVFDAKILVQNNTLVLKVLDSKDEAGFKTLSLSGFDKTNPELKNLLEQFGLPLLPESFKLLQFAISMGIKLVPQKLVKAFRNGAKAGEYSSERAQTALLLDEKGLKVTDEAVDGLMERFGSGDQSGSGGQSTGGQNSGDEARHAKDDSGENERQDDEMSPGVGTTGGQTGMPSGVGVPAVVQSSPVSADEIKAYFKSVDKASVTNKAGLLTLFNSALSKRQESADWLVFPFEWDYENYSGVIRVLLSENKKSVQKILVNCNNSLKNLIFVLYLKGEKIESVKAAFKGNFNGGFTDVMQKKLASFFEGAEVKTVSFEELEGFAVDNPDIAVFKGEA